MCKIVKSLRALCVVGAWAAMLMPLGAVNAKIYRGERPIDIPADEAHLHGAAGRIPDEGRPHADEASNDPLTGGMAAYYFDGASVQELSTLRDALNEILPENLATRQSILPHVRETICTIYERPEGRPTVGELVEIIHSIAPFIEDRYKVAETPSDMLRTLSALSPGVRVGVFAAMAHPVFKAEFPSTSRVARILETAAAIQGRYIYTVAIKPKLVSTKGKSRRKRNTAHKRNARLLKAYEQKEALPYTPTRLVHTADPKGVRATLEALEQLMDQWPKTPKRWKYSHATIADEIFSTVHTIVNDPNRRAWKKVKKAVLGKANVDMKPKDVRHLLRNLYETIV